MAVGLWLSILSQRDIPRRSTTIVQPRIEYEHCATSIIPLDLGLNGDTYEETIPWMGLMTKTGGCHTRINQIFSKDVHECNKENEAENYTLRSWAWFKEYKEGKNIVISGMHKGDLGYEFQTALIGTHQIPACMFSKEDYKILKGAYEGKNLLGRKGDMGVRESKRIGFEDYTDCHEKPTKIPEGMDGELAEE